MNNSLTDQDNQQLGMLATAFRIVGGLCALCVNFAWIHVIVGFATMFGAGSGQLSSSKPDSMPPGFGVAFGGVFVFAGLFVIACGYVMGYFGFRAAKALENRSQWKLCFGVSIAFMLFQPLGLVLGILSLIVLSRPTVKQAFGEIS